MTHSPAPSTTAETATCMPRCSGSAGAIDRLAARRRRRPGISISAPTPTHAIRPGMDKKKSAIVLLSACVRRQTPMTVPSSDLQTQFGEIDIYLFDQLLRGRFDGRRRVLDAGCGHGRNLPYLLRAGFEVYAIDEDPAAVVATRKLAASVAPALPPDNIRQGALHVLPWPDGRMDAVVCSAVLHFARDRVHFERMVEEMWRVLARGGLFFARLASSIGIEGLIG